MSVLAGPFTIACVLLAFAGGAKAVRPGDTANALAAVKLPHGRALVRVGGAAELAIAVAALVTGEPVLAALVALSYLAFAGFVAIALRSGTPISSCGCFGKADTPPSMVHVAIDLAAAGVGAAVAITSANVAIGDVLADQPMLGIPFGLLVAIGTYLAFLALTGLPKTFAAVRLVHDAR